MHYMRSACTGGNGFSRISCFPCRQGSWNEYKVCFVDWRQDKEDAAEYVVVEFPEKCLSL
jgi:hypothetical protein